MKKFIAYLKSSPEKITLLLVNFIFLVFLVPFWTSNNLLAWDFVGHISAINYTKDFLFPNFQGWNNVNSLGYPQGYFYPPFWHYLIAGLSLIYNSPEFWIKLLFTISMLAMPWAAYYFFSGLISKLRFSKSKKHISLAASLVFVLCIIFGPAVYGGTLRSFLSIGLITNFFSLVILTLYLGFLIRIPEKYNLKRVIVLAFLLTILMLSHLVSGLVALLITLSFFFFFDILKFDLKYSGKSLHKLLHSNYFLALAITFVNTAFFYIPLVSQTEILAPITGINVSLSITFGLGLFVILIFVFAFILRKNISLRFLISLILPFVFFVSLAVIEVFSRRFGINLFMDRIQPYRLLSFSLIFLPSIATILTFKLIEQIDIKRFPIKEKAYAVFLSILGFIMLLSVLGGLYLYRNHFRSYGDITFKEENIESKMDGNYISFFRTYDSYYLYRTPYYPDITIGRKINFVNTQFNESSFLDAYLIAIQRSLLEDPFDNDSENPNFPETYDIEPNEALGILKLMNVDYIVYAEGAVFKANPCAEESVFTYADIELFYPEKKNINLLACKIDPAILSGLKLSPNELDSSRKWLEVSREQVEDQKDEVYFDDEKSGEKSTRFAKTPLIGTNSPEVVVYQKRIDWFDENQSFKVDTRDFEGKLSVISTEPLDIRKSDTLSKDLIVVPVQFNESWDAYRISNGQKTEIEIYRVAPNLIAIDSLGEIVFEYRDSSIKTSMKAISLASIMLTSGGILVMGFYWLKGKRR